MPKSLRENVDLIERQPPLKRVIILIFYLSLISSLLLYLLTAFFGGGDAWHGRKIAGRFFVAHNDGAPEHEVSRNVFYMSLWSLRLLFSLWLTGMLAAAYRFMAKRLR